jgi:hypothetical protein
MKNKMKDAGEVLKIYLQVADAFYNLQAKNGVKFTKGRLKFRKDVKKAVETGIITIKIIEWALSLPKNNGIRYAIIEKFKEFEEKI